MINHHPGQSVDAWQSLYSQLLNQDDLDRLGIQPQSDDRAIQRQFKKISLEYHPDKNKGVEHLASKVFSLLSESKDNLLKTNFLNRVHVSFEETAEEKERREEWEITKKTADEMKRIDTLSLKQAKQELREANVSDIPEFDKSEALRSHIASLEHKAFMWRLFVISQICLVCFVLHKVTTNQPKTKPKPDIVKNIKTS